MKEQHACAAVVAPYSSHAMQAPPAVTRKVAAISSRSTFSVQIMFVNNRVSVQSYSSEPFDSLLFRVSNSFWYLQSCI